MSFLKYRLHLLVPILLIAAGSWGVTAGLAHDVRPWAIRWTGPGFGISLVASYVTAWSVAILLARHESRLMAFRAVGTTVTLAVLLGVLEAPALLGLLDYSLLWTRLSGEWRGPATSFVSDPDLVFRRPAHQSWTGRPRSDMAVAWNLPIRAARPQSFTTDARGFRNRREIDRADVALLGDSYVEGAYVSDEETCAAVLEARSGLRVANLGQSGYGTLQEREVLERFALPLGPRLIALFFFEGNDLYDDQEFENALLYPREHGASDAGWRFDWSRFRDASFTATAFRLLRRLLDPLLPTNVATFGWYRDEEGKPCRLYFYDYASLHWDDFESARFEKTKAAFRSAQRLCAKRGVELILFFIPTKFRVYGDYCGYPPESPCREWKSWDLPLKFREFCREAHMDCVDLTVPMRRAAAAGKLLYAPEDSHWNHEGHELVAEIVYDLWNRYSAVAPPAPTTR